MKNLCTYENFHKNNQKLTMFEALFINFLRLKNWYRLFKLKICYRISRIEKVGTDFLRFEKLVPTFSDCKSWYRLSQIQKVGTDFLR